MPLAALTSSARARLRPYSGVPGVWAGFVVVHAYLVGAVYHRPNMAFGDVDLYLRWAAGGLNFGTWPVLDFDWVYPFGALAPIVLPGLVSLDTDVYRVLFMALVTLLNAAAVGVLLRRGKRRTLGAWWWLAFLALLGPISLARLDGIAAPLTVIALAQLIGSDRAPEGRVGLASALATFAAWIKIAPGAALVPLALTDRRPWRRVVAPAVAVTVVVLGVAAAGGGASRILGFLTAQDDRGLQVESGAATPFSVARLWGADYAPFFNKPLNVIEIAGRGTHAMAQSLDVLLLLAVAAITLLTWRAAVNQRRDLPDPADRREPQLELVLLSTTALTLALFAFDKVGSPQYVAWFAPPVAVALTAFRPAEARVAGARAWQVVAWVLLGVALLTQILYPVRYGAFLRGVPFDVVSEGVRNVAVLVLAAWLTVLLSHHARPASSGRRAASADEPAADDLAR